MNAYLFPIKIALFTFPIAAFFLTLPFLIVQYRKYGYVNKVRSLVLYSMLLYFISAYYLVILPLPANRDNCVPGGSGVFSQWIPFTFIRDIMKETNVVWSQPSTYVQILGERSFWQAAFNVALTLPLGYICVIISRNRSWGRRSLPLSCPSSSRRRSARACTGCMHAHTGCSMSMICFSIRSAGCLDFCWLP